MSVEKEMCDIKRERENQILCQVLGNPSRMSIE